MRRIALARHLILGAMFSALVVMMTGCATIPGDNIAKSSYTAFKEGDYSLASRYYTSALSETPSTHTEKRSKKYRRTSLKYAKREMKQAHWDDAYFLIKEARSDAPSEELRDSDEMLDEIAYEYAELHFTKANRAKDARDLQRAIAEFDLVAATHVARAQDGSARAKALRTKRAGLLAQLDQAKDLIGAAEWAAADRLIGIVRAQDITLRDAADDVRRLLLKEHSASCLAKAKTLREQNKLITAYQACKEALRIVKGSDIDATEAKRLLIAIRSDFDKAARSKLDELYAKDERSLLEQFAKGYDTVEQPDRSSQIRQVLKDRERADACVARAKSLEDAGAVYESIPLLDEATSVWKSNTGIREHLASTRIRAAEKAKAQQQQASKKDCCFLALFYRAMQDVCMKKPVSIRDDAVTSLVKDPLSLGQLLFALPIAFQGNTEGMKLPELEAAVKKGLPTLGMQGHDMNPELDRLGVTVSIKSFQVKTDKDSHAKSVRYVSHTVAEANPEYYELQRQQAEAQREMIQAQRSYEQAQRAAAQSRNSNNSSLGALAGLAALGSVVQDLSAQNRYNDLTAKLRYTSPTVDRDVYTTSQYIVYTYTRNGAVHAEIQLTTPLGVFRRPIVIKEEHQDETHDGFPAADVDRDPLKLPDEKKILNTMWSDFQGKLAARTGELFSEFLQRQDGAISGMADREKRWNESIKWAARFPCYKWRALEEVQTASVLANADTFTAIWKALKGSGAYDDYLDHELAVVAEALKKAPAARTQVAAADDATRTVGFGGVLQSPQPTAPVVPMEQIKRDATPFPADYDGRSIVAAVVPLAAQGFAQTEALTLTEEVTAALAKCPCLELVSNADMKAILAEQKKFLDCSEGSCLVEMGQILQAQQLVAGSVGKIGEAYTITLRVIDVESGKVIGVERGRCFGRTDYLLDTVWNAGRAVGWSILKRMEEETGDVAAR